MEDELVRAEELGLDYVGGAPGRHLGCGEDEGVAAVARSLSWLHERTRGFRVRLLLEITAGQGSCLGCRFEEVAASSSAAPAATAWASASTPATPWRRPRPDHRRRLRRVFADFDRTIGLERLLAFHLNDSKTPLGSRVDRHQEIGDGFLGLLPFWRLVNDPRFARTPAVLETPSGPDKQPSFARNLERLRALIGSPRPSMPPPVQSKKATTARCSCVLALAVRTAADVATAPRTGRRRWARAPEG
jgi:deoxyribonuclease-4